MEVGTAALGGSVEGMSFRVGVDVGGTFTDIAIADQEGRVYRQKVFTTPGSWHTGIIEGVTAGAKNHFAVSARDLLERVIEFNHGSTIVTNVMAQKNGKRVGLITTRGFADTLSIARSARNSELDLQLQVGRTSIIDRNDVREVDERIDRHGDCIVDLDTSQVEDVLDDLVESGIEVLAVCLLWSFVNPNHEELVRKVAASRYPDLPVFVSWEVYPVIREYERMVTTVLTAYVSGGVRDYLGNLRDELSHIGLRVPINVMQCTGGLTSVEDIQARPLTLLHSGPAGGVIAASAMTRRLGIDRAICADMGGTSFDVSLIEKGRVTSVDRASVEGLQTGLTILDIVSIGAGGGSIAYIDSSGRPQLGPRSAGADPGPVCYGRGGTAPTTTDIAAVLGFFGTRSLLWGGMTIAVDDAWAAIERDVAGPLGLPVVEAARGLYRVAVAAMAQAVRSVTVERGQDPREYAFVSYGGASGLFIAEIADELGITEILVPACASVFSAYGMLCSEQERSYSQSVGWNVANGSLREIESLRDGLIDRATSSLGLGREQVHTTVSANLKLGTQSFEVQLKLPPFDDGPTFRRSIFSDFREAYEVLYGEGTYWEGGDALLTMATLRVTCGSVQSHSSASMFVPPPTPGAGNAGKRTRALRWPHELEATVLVPEHTSDGSIERGPAVFDAGDTTIWVPRGWSIALDGSDYRIWKDVSHDGV